MAAHTLYEIKFTLKRVVFFSNHVQIEPKVYLRLVLLEKYVETEDIYLLNHEIGHYLLGCICVLEFKHKVQD
jgi:hypothetical protein